jgi:hypothetical protein
VQAQEKLQMHTDALQQLKSSCAAFASYVRALPRVVLTRRSCAGTNMPRSPLTFRSAANALGAVCGGCRCKRVP